MQTRLSFILPLTACALLSLLTPIVAAAELPLKRVVLFTSGVGFFQREGEVRETCRSICRSAPSRSTTC